MIDLFLHYCDWPLLNQQKELSNKTNLPGRHIISWEEHRNELHTEFAYLSSMYTNQCYRSTETNNYYTISHLFESNYLHEKFSLFFKFHIKSYVEKLILQRLWITRLSLLNWYWIILPEYILLILQCCYIFFFFFKQKTAYEIVSRDWSSDVCSSDLVSIALSTRLWWIFKGFRNFKNAQKLHRSNFSTLYLQ